MSNFHHRPIPLWLAAAVAGAVFVGGLLIGNQLSGFSSGVVIKGHNNQPNELAGEVANASSTPLPDYLTKDVDFKLFWDVWDIVRNNYYDQNVPETQMFYGALAGLVGSLEDPYSVFMTPQGAEEFNRDLEGNFEGIGAEISIREDMLTVIAPLPDSPAERAGLKAKDVILTINGTSTVGMTIDYAVNLIRGPKDTQVVLNISRQGTAEPFDIKIIRQSITIASVSWSKLTDGQTAKIAVRQFNGETMSLFDQAINQIIADRGIKYVILDLRNNPGGYLDSAVDMAGEWVSGEPVVRERLRDGTETVHQTNRTPRLAGYPTIVLVNGGSASGAEIVAGALQDWGKGKLVGETTFGKGSVQDLIELADGSSVKITIAKWFTPKNRSIDQTGIEPDVIVEMTDEDYNKDRDPQLAKALELLRQ